MNGRQGCGSRLKKMSLHNAVSLMCSERYGFHSIWKETRAEIGWEHRNDLGFDGCHDMALICVGLQSKIEFGYYNIKVRCGDTGGWSGVSSRILQDDVGLVCGHGDSVKCDVNEWQIFPWGDSGGMDIENEERIVIQELDRLVFCRDFFDMVRAREDYKIISCHIRRQRCMQIKNCSDSMLI